LGILALFGPDSPDSAFLGLSRLTIYAEFSSFLDMSRELRKPEGARRPKSRSLPSNPLSSEQDFADNLVDFDPNDLVVHDNQLGACRIPCNLTQLRIIFMALSKVRREEDSFHPIAFSRQEFSRILGLKHNGFSGREFREFVEDETMSLKVHYTRWHRKWGKGKGCLHVFSQCEYFEGAGIVGLKFNEDMRPMLKDLQSEFTCYRLANILACNSAHTIRMYMLLRPYAGLSNGKKFAIEEIREALDIDPESYPVTRTFVHSVIKPAVAHISANTDIAVSFRPVKEGRTTTGFIFRMTPIEGNQPRAFSREEEPLLPGFIESLAH
jgi:hypothetical protein